MEKKTDLQYGIDDVPPWYTTILLAFQHYLTMFGATIAIPLVVTPLLCLGDDEVARSEIIGTCFFVSGLVTLLQTTLGVRLPIVQGGTFALVSPIIAIMSLPEWACDTDLSSGLNTTNEYNISDKAGDTEEWHIRMREVQGAIMLAALLQVAVGLSGIMGPMLRFIGPLTIAPTITLIGLSLFEAAPAFCSQHWGVAFLTMGLLILFSQYLRNCDLPCCKFIRGKGCSRRNAPIFKLFPVILAIVLSWLFCWILTVSGALPDDPGAPGYGARTDSKIHVLVEAKWFNLPYPGQWGMPTFSAASVLGMMAGILAGMIESIGDYYACARLAGAPPPPTHAINRGVFIEGLGCIIAGLFGTGTGTTSYSENIGAIGITKVGSRRVMQVGGVLMMILGILGKFGALFVTIPEPVVGGVFMVMFGMISAVGVSNLQFVDLNSSRNLFVFGFAVFVGLSCPAWLAANPGLIDTGSAIADQILTVLATTSMFVGGSIGFVLDNTIPGTRVERGIDSWSEILATTTSTKPDKMSRLEVIETGTSEDQQCMEFTPAIVNISVGKVTNDSGPYDLPCGMSVLRKLWWTKFIPISPTFDGCFRCGRDKKQGDDAAA